MTTPNKNGGQMYLPGLIHLQRLADGTAIARVVGISQWLTVRECCERGHCGEDLIYARCQDGTLTHTWKNHVGPRGTLLVDAQSFSMWMQERVQVGRLHPQLALK
jgi:hypothetical protein